MALRAYEPCALRGAVLFFVLNDLASVDPMYQFSLEAYEALFRLSLENSPKKENVQERIDALNAYHTYSVYKYGSSLLTAGAEAWDVGRYTARGLFERHKLLLSLQMAFSIERAEGRLPAAEFDFFLRGSSTLNRAADVDASFPQWLPKEAKESLAALQTLKNDTAIVQSISSDADQWEQWYRLKEPENAAPPYDGDHHALTNLILLRCLRSPPPNPIPRCHGGVL